MDRLDILSFLCTSFVVAYLTGINGTELVAMQVVWFGALWIGKRLINRYVDGRC